MPAGTHSRRKIVDERLVELAEAVKTQAAAVAWLEKTRWGKKPCCPRCSAEGVYQMRNARTGGRQRDFRWRCRSCKGQFTVRTGTVMEESRLPLTKWVHAFWRVCASKKGVSALQIKRELDVAYPTALFLLNRVRLAMSDWGLSVLKKLGGSGKTVEADETYVGGKPRYKGQSPPGRGTRKTAVFVAVERGGGTRLQIVERVSANCLGAAMRQHVSESSRLMTDEWASYKPIGVRFEGGHEVVVHSQKEYVRKGDAEIHSNTAESVFALLKRGMIGTFHSVSKKHLPRYLSEFGFRWNHRHRSDADRTERAVRKAVGRRLFYKPPRHEVRGDHATFFQVGEADGTGSGSKGESG